ncbi:hypothetical protein BMS3Abin17_00018 [archaeon BMS3Abin17]|nr:hypothetical protein BMS3Abin17_00018 [archaeon BMS3Abin17]HDZ61251.1 hypothetical protein [Candidatus Pacearchaeota archaeon]
MKRDELESKYGKELINKIFAEGYLDGCTITINKDGSEDIPEIDIQLAIKGINGGNINDNEWD